MLKEGLLPLQGQTAVHSAASQNANKLRKRNRATDYQQLELGHKLCESRVSFANYAPVNLHYEQTVSTLLAHAGANSLSVQDEQVPKLRTCVSA